MGVVGTLHDGNSTLMLVTTRLKYVSKSGWSSQRYLDVTLLGGGRTGWWAKGLSESEREP